MMRQILAILFIVSCVQGLGCDVNPCVNGECVTDDGNTYTCLCQPSWAGIRCNLPKPEVLCGNKTIDIFIDKRIVTEQGLPGSAEFVHFYKAPGCVAVEKNGGFHLNVKAPFKDCGIIITREGNDYSFYQQIVWNRFVDDIERPLVLLNFTCNYQDRYTVSFGPITPFVTTVDFETSYGTFKVDMKLYKTPEFSDDEKYGARPVVAIEDDVCVSTELKNVMPKDLVLTNRECWASTKRDGTGDSHYLVSDKCKDDPTTQMFANGEGDNARFCFQMFKWKDSMDEIYMHCIVNVCNVTAFPEYCQCQSGRSKRSAPSFQDESTKITYGPIYPWEADNFNGELPSDIILINDYGFLNGDPESDKKKNSGSDPKTTILIAVGVVLVISLIVLGVAVAVYINCRRKSRDQKTYLRNEGEPVVIPNPAIYDAYIEPNI